MAESGALFGADLRSERERRGISLEKMCAETKLNLRYLSALERGDFKALPRGGFRRGVGRAYLSAVGLAEQVWMPRFESCYASDTGGEDSQGSNDAWVTFAVNVKRNRGIQRSRNLKRWLGVLLLLIILLGASWAVWTYLLQGAMRH